MSTEVQPLRSFLFAPGNHARRVEKALTLDADAVILDLEDAVATAEKPATRETVAAALERPRRGRLYVRVNAVDTEFCYGDLVAIVRPGLDGVILPKVESAAGLVTVDWLLAQLERDRGLPPGGIDLIPIIETARGLDRLGAILAAGSRVRRVAFGAGDFTLDVNMAWSRDEAELVHARATIVTASRAAGIEAPLDTVWVEPGRPRWARSLGPRRPGLRLPGQDVHPSRPDRDCEPGLYAKRCRDCLCRARRCRLRQGRSGGQRGDPARRQVHRLPDRLPGAAGFAEDFCDQGPGGRAMTENPAGPLDGITVLDLCSYLAGPYGCTLLADLGADVIKIEPPQGDMLRQFPSSLAGESRFFLGTNRGKRALALDLKQPDGLAVLHRMVASSDVLVENFRPSVPARLGIDYPRLRAINPRLVYAGLTGYGDEGPLSDKGGFDQVLQCLSGMAVFQGGGADKPQLVLGSVLDYFTSALLAYGVAAALFQRERNGKGQYLSLSLLRSALTIQAGRFVWAESEGRDVARDFRHWRVNRHPPDQARSAIHFGALQPFLRRAVRADRPAGAGK